MASCWHTAARSQDRRQQYGLSPLRAVNGRVTKPVLQTFGSSSGDLSPVFSPDGSKLAFIRTRDLFSRSVLIQPMSGDSPARDPLEITDYEQTIGDMDWAADGRSLIVGLRVSNNQSSLWRLDLNGKLTRLGIGGLDAAGPSVSRKGNRLAYESRQLDVNIYRLDGPGPDGGSQPFDRCHLARVIDSTSVDREPMLSRTDTGCSSTPSAGAPRKSTSRIVMELTRWP